MRAFVAAAAGAAVAITVSAQSTPAQCFERYQCVFHHDVNGQEWSWDMSTLCRGPGQEYSYTDSLNHTFSFNICGNTSTICAPNYPLYDSHGVAVQTWTDAPPCTNGPKSSGCFDWDTGAPVCCTGNCAVLGIDFFQFQILNPADPAQGGVQMVHVGMPPDDADPFNCPINPQTGLARERQLTIQLLCDPNGSTTSLTVLGASEPSTCAYVLTAKTKAACGTKGDPFDGYRNNPGVNFLMVCIGSALTIFTFYSIRFADNRGYLEPVKNRMPACCRCCCNSAGSSGYSSSYKSVGGASATPITASAYGTA